VSDETDETPIGDEPSAGQPVDPETLAAELDTEEAGLIATYDKMPLRWKLVALGVMVLIIVILLAIWHDLTFRWFEIHTGTVNESGPYYGFWSGFGSDIGEATLVVGVFAAWRHHSCHVRGCARLGRQVEGTPYLACPRHHPAHRGSKRSVTLETIHTAHVESMKSPTT